MNRYRFTVHSKTFISIKTSFTCLFVIYSFTCLFLYLFSSTNPVEISTGNGGSQEYTEHTYFYHSQHDQQLKLVDE
jgi:hypothetical protein